MIGLSSPRHWLYCAAIAVSVSLCSPTGLVAQSSAATVDAPAAKKIVKDIRIVFNGPAAISESRVRAQMSTREGEAYTDESVAQDIKNLFAVGATVLGTKADDVAGGVRVTFTIAGGGTIGEVGFQGNSQFDNEKLAKTVEVKVGEPVDEAKLAVGQQKIRELYEKKGFGEVSVNFQTSQMPQAGFTRVTFVIGEGARGLVGDINFEGNNSIKASELRSKLSLKQRAMWRVWRGKSGRISDQSIIEDTQAIEKAYQDQGYVYAKVSSVRREAADDKHMNITYVINEGVKYDVANVNIEGITVFTAEELRPALKSVKGFAYSGSDVKDDEKMLGDYYGSRGYADAHVATSVIPAGDGLVNVVYRISEGQKSFIRKINISGNSITQDRVIRRELPYAPGEELNTVKQEAGKNRLQNLGYFSQVDVRNNDTEQPGYKDVDVAVTEQSTGTVNFGAGFSSIDSLVGFLDLTQTNFDIGGWPHFRGAGQRFNLGVKYGTKRRDFQMSLTEPYFLGQKLSFTTELFYRDLYYLSDVFDQQNYGGALNFRKPLGEHSYLEFGYTLQNIKIQNIDEKASPEIKAEEGDFLQSKIDISWVHDTRDSMYITRHGHKIEIGALMSGSFLGGDADVYGLNATASQFFNLPWDTILSIDGSVKTVDTWGSGNRVPIFERLFLGGANNLRGFDYRDVGPKDQTGEPLGGLTSAYASVEYTFPIMEKVRGAVFYDVGLVSGSAYDWGGVVNSDVGIGLRLYLPIGPIRVDFGIPVQSDAFNDSSGQFNFNVGYKF
jgi:outer membrane protein insertion porin family